MSHTAQLNEYVGAVGRNHIISPIGYGIVAKSVILGSPVRSAAEQYAIHKVATQFESPILYIPRVYTLVNRLSYTMEHIECGHYIAPPIYKLYSELLPELTKFFKFMIAEGYYPYNFTILRTFKHRFVLLDFSLFGTFERGRVRFKQSPPAPPIDLFRAEEAFGILSFILCPALDPEKIDECIWEELKKSES